jgi:peptidoglycan hydrolase CwlO-like protein
MDDQEQQEAVRQAGEFETYVENLTNRLIEAEAVAESFKHTVHLQESQLERAQATIEKQGRRINDLIRDNHMMHKALRNNYDTAKEAFAQLMQTPREQPRQQETLGADRLRVIRHTAADNAARDAG